MTLTRPEIQIEGSDDGESWQAYEFRYKPGGLTRRLPLCAPHQPRLDWQMWFAALRPLRTTQWVQLFLRRLLEGEPAVTRLLAHDPFAGRQPRYLRVLRYEYEFTTPKERRASGARWKRTLVD